MEFGDGKDNDLDGDIDEDECCKYKCFNILWCSYDIYLCMVYLYFNVFVF